MASLNFKNLRQDAMQTITGWFTATIVDASVVRNSNGDPMIKTKFKITGGQYDGRPVWTNFNIIPSNPGALRMFFLHMNLLGLDESFFDAMPDFGDGPDSDLASAGFIASSLLGRTTDIEVGSRVWQGTAREEIKSYRTPQGGGGLPGSGAPSALPTALPGGLPGSPPSALPTASPLPTPAEPTNPVPELPF